MRIETLKWVQMPIFLNSSCLRMYRKPLTKEILRQLHMANTYKGEQAQQEA